MSKIIRDITHESNSGELHCYYDDSELIESIIEGVVLARGGAIFIRNDSREMPDINSYRVINVDSLSTAIVRDSPDIIIYDGLIAAYDQMYESLYGLPLGPIRANEAVFRSYSSLLLCGNIVALGVQGGYRAEIHKRGDGGDLVNIYNGWDRGSHVVESMALMEVSPSRLASLLLYGTAVVYSIFIRDEMRGIENDKSVSVVGDMHSHIGLRRMLDRFIHDRGREMVVSRDGQRLVIKHHIELDERGNRQYSLRLCDASLTLGLYGYAFDPRSIISATSKLAKAIYESLNRTPSIPYESMEVVK